MYPTLYFWLDCPLAFIYPGFAQVAYSRMAPLGFHPCRLACRGPEPQSFVDPSLKVKPLSRALRELPFRWS